MRMSTVTAVTLENAPPSHRGAAGGSVPRSASVPSMVARRPPEPAAWGAGDVASSGNGGSSSWSGWDDDGPAPASQGAQPRAAAGAKKAASNDDFWADADEDWGK